MSLYTSDRIDRLHKVATFYGISENDGELTKTVEREAYGEALLGFAQACFEISRLAKMPADKKARRTKEAQLRKRLEQVVKRVVPSDRIVTRRWHHPTFDQNRNYEVDVHVDGDSRELLLFAVGTGLQILRASVTSLHYQKQADYLFDSIAVLDQTKSHTAHDTAVLDDSMTIVIPSSSESELEEYIKERIVAA